MGILSLIFSNLSIASSLLLSISTTVKTPGEERKSSILEKKKE
jgi:hypothetical protein